MSGSEGGQSRDNAITVEFIDGQARKHMACATKSFWIIRELFRNSATSLGMILDLFS